MSKHMMLLVVIGAAAATAYGLADYGRRKVAASSGATKFGAELTFTEAVLAGARAAAGADPLSPEAYDRAWNRIYGGAKK